VVVNENHTKLCPSPDWAAHLQEEVLPQITAHVELGKEMLEIGPGPGAATEWLRHRVGRLVAVESDAPAVARLADRFADTNVEVIHGDATALQFASESFDSVGLFTMLHHVPTPALQLALLTEAARVVRPGGVLIGSDSLGSNGLHEFHADDTYNPIDPPRLLVWLQSLGLVRITLHVDYDVRFAAHKPQPATKAPDSSDACDVSERNQP
jgi:SAM-dependent methyltransferase